MKAFFISLLISTGMFAQWDYHAHFWGSGVVTFGLHFKFGKPETFKCPSIVMGIGTLKEIIDPFFGGTRSALDIRADYTGAVLGFMISDSLKRYRIRKRNSKFELSNQRPYDLSSTTG